MIKENQYKKVILLLLVLNPIVDLLTGFQSVYMKSSMSVGAIARIAFLGFLVLDHLIYIVRVKDARWKGQLIYFIAVLLYIATYYLYYSKRMHPTIGLQQTIFAVRYLSFPAFYLTLKKYAKAINMTSIFRCLSLVSVIYSVFIIVPFITNTGFESYTIDQLKGHVGWFVGANEIGTIIGLSSLAIVPNIEKKITYLFAYLISALALIIIGTKAGLLFLLIGIILISAMFYKANQYKHKFKVLMITSLTLIIIIFFSPAMQNLIVLLTNNKDLNIVELLLSGRTVFLENGFNLYKIVEPIRKVIGFGFYTSTPKLGYQLLKLVEMDLFDVFFSLGIIGTIVMFYHFIPDFIRFIKNEIIDLKNRVGKPLTYKVGLVIVITLILLGAMIGHVFTAPSVSLIFALVSNSLFETQMKYKK